MSYFFTDASENEFEGPSISGWRAVHTLLKGRETEFPALAQIRQHGMTNMLVELRSECNKLARGAPKDVVPTLKRLAKSAGKADEVLILQM